jgi:arsenate reductase (thioredoxin)
MAQGFLQSFDKNMDVHSAGTEPGLQVNQKAVRVMTEAGIDISHHTPKLVDIYLKDKWDYVITVCDDANETCPAFFGKVKHRLHMGFEDPSRAQGSEEHIFTEFRRIRNEIKNSFYNLYTDKIKPQL